jgi:excisionase family DNA binding protein
MKRRTAKDAPSFFLDGEGVMVMSMSKDSVASVWLNRKQLAKHLNLSLRTIDYMTKAGEIPFVPFGRRAKRFHRPTIDGILLERQQRGNGKDQ